MKLGTFGLAAAIACGPAGDDDRQHLTGDATDHCTDAVEGVGHGGSYHSLAITLVHRDDLLIFEDLPTFACPVEAEDDGATLRVPSQDCAEGRHEEVDLHGAGHRDGETIVLDLESTELRPLRGETTGPTHPVPCTHHYELVPADH